MPKKTTQRNGSPLYWSAESWAFISLRLFLSLKFILAGLGKFQSPEGAYSIGNNHSGVAQWIIGEFERTNLPGFLVAPYAHSIAYVELILGLLLLLGVKTKWAIALISLTYVSLAYGQMVLGNNEKVTEIGTYLLFTTAALYFVRHNKFEALR